MQGTTRAEDVKCHCKLHQLASANPSDPNTYGSNILKTAADLTHIPYTNLHHVTTGMHKNAMAPQQWKEVSSFAPLNWQDLERASYLT